MAKQRTVYICQECSFESPKWLGKCPSCGSWNSLEEEVTERKSTVVSNQKASRTEPVKLNEISVEKQIRLKSGISELDRILGGGIVPGSMVLIGGEPGIGKSTLALQLALTISGKVTLYISGEESEQQIHYRAKRLKHITDQCLILTETNVEEIIFHIERVKPDIIIVDSIQTLQSETLESSAGTVTQIRECTTKLQKKIKTLSIPTFLIGHINKEGNLAGPKVLEHVVDVVLQFEGDQNHFYRLLRASKNRFGSTSELGIFEMQSDGLKEVLNPSEVLINQIDESLSGVAIAAALDGTRPFLIEVQSLVSTAAYGTPQRTSTGYDVKRLNMLLAVLEKKAGFRLSSKDVFLNIAGGIKLTDPAMDLPIIMAILSSNFDFPIRKDFCFCAEIGLSGEIRPVIHAEQRIKEADKLGFKKIFIANGNYKSISHLKTSCEIKTFSRIEDLVKKIFTQR